MIVRRASAARATRMLPTRMGGFASPYVLYIYIYIGMLSTYIYTYNSKHDE